MTRLGDPIPPMVTEIRCAIEDCCAKKDYNVIDAQNHVTGRDFLFKIWMLIASTPLSIAILHEDVPVDTQNNIFYELGVAQAMGKETLIVKSPNAKVPSDFVRSEYIKYDDNFNNNLNSFLDTLLQQADHYETMADQLEKNPILALDFLKRAFLITENTSLQTKAENIVKDEKLENRAANSVELQAASF